MFSTDMANVPSPESVRPGSSDVILTPVRNSGNTSVPLSLRSTSITMWSSLARSPPPSRARQPW